ncbi:hypothetical protein DFO70_11766 [Cytobacillus firmus]|uniref:Uncharacterized protein n=2 Tax=Cytobacillus TaxID=2675230 RepID=A0A366JKA8_CYTFI|nr:MULTISPECIES: hypothetical protein [Cytobacillus]RBP87875.1 hypothetical protein DFO70_11766 [Cytobacillus firmus]TDX39238.1 hypothetical protein DFO72_11168 [Cytobacillus oceanisediminis]
MDELSLSFSIELVKLIDEYQRCNDVKIQVQIQSDILLLKEALMLINHVNIHQ